MDKETEIYNRLKQLITNLECELNYKTIFQLLVAVVLSAQCTDKRVNMVTPELFERYPDAETMSRANIEDVEGIIRPCGTYRVKAKNIIELSKVLVSNFDGVVPKTIDELILLPGVGRKTANVILAEGYKIPALPVDTHILRVSNRLGLAMSDDPNIVEKTLKNKYPQNLWIELHYLLLLFGRYYCKALGYNCTQCVLFDLCNYSDKKIK